MAKGQIIGYRRISTSDQRAERQLDGVKVDRLFEDTASGKNADRPQLQAALSYVRDGDELVVHSMDRLARNMLDLLQMVRDLNARGVTVRFLKEALAFDGRNDSPLARLQLGILGAFAEFERQLIRERQREGIALAKARGAYKGRKPALYGDRLRELRRRDEKNAGRNRAALAREFGVSRATLYQYLRAV